MISDSNVGEMTFYADGNYSFSEKNAARTQSDFGSGRYHYDACMNELFVEIHVLNQKQAEADTSAQRSIDKRYFKLVERNDSTLTVLAILQGELDWTVDANGAYHLLNSNSLPLEKKVYRCSKNK